MSDFDEYFDQVLYFGPPRSGRSEPTPTQRWQAYWQRTAQSWAESTDPMLAQAAAQGFVLLTAQARARGVSRARARWSVGRGVWQSPASGVLAPLDIRLEAPWRAGATERTADARVVGRRSMALAAAGAALSHPAHTVSGRSAAVLHGLPAFHDPGSPVLTAAPAAALGRHGAILARGAALPPAVVDTWFGVQVTTPARTVVDLARLDRWDGIIAADAALRSGTASAAGLRAAAARARGWPGVRQAREIVAMADAGAESPLESLTRLRLLDDGFPPPATQVEIRVPGRHRPYRVDFCWPQHRLILEADGRVKYRGDGQWAEKAREIALRKLGYRIERVRWSDVVDDWPATSRMLWAALRASSPHPWS